MYTDIPDGTKLLGLTIKDGVATVDLSAEFESGGGRASILGRLAQVVYTLTQFPTVDQVLFKLDGEPVTVFGGAGVRLDHPVGRDDYTNQLPAIFMDRPAYGAALGHPGRVSGVANVFEATFRVRLPTPTAPSWSTARSWRAAARGAGARTRWTWRTRVQGPVRDAPRVRPVSEGRHPGEHHRVPGLAHPGAADAGQWSRGRTRGLSPGRSGTRQQAPDGRLDPLDDPSGGTAPPTGGARRTRPTTGRWPASVEMAKIRRRRTRSRARRTAPRRRR